MDIEIRLAANPDLEAMHRILTAAGLSTQEVLDPGSSFWVACQGTNVVGTCGLEVDGSNGLVRSVCVDPGCRAGGIGRALVDQAIASAGSRGIGQLFLFSKDTGTYFLSLGWVEVPVEVAAAALRRAPQVQRYDRVGWYPNERAFSLSLGRAAALQQRG